MMKLNTKTIVAGVIGVAGIGAAIYNAVKKDNYTSLPITTTTDVDGEEVEVEIIETEESEEE